MKHAREYRPVHRKGIDALAQTRPVEAYIVYLGDRELKVDDIREVPAHTFVERLHDGAVIG